MKPGTFVWAPPPAGASVCLEELRKARMKRQKSTHVVIIPKLMTSLWLKQFYKTMDLVIHVEANNSFWNKNQFESLIIGICLPYAAHFPWLTRNTPKMYQVGREVRRLLPEKGLAARDILRKLLVEGRQLPTMPPDVVRRVLYFTPRATVSCNELSTKTTKRKSGKNRSSDQRLEENPPTKRRILQGQKR